MSTRSLDLKIVTAGGVVQMQKGPVIMIFNQYAHIGTGKTIHSSVQLEEFGLEVNEKSVRVPGGLQHIKMPDGYVHPIQINEGLPYVALCPYTDDEWAMLPHPLTHDSDWDPTIFNLEFNDDDDEWHDAVMDHIDLFNRIGNYRNRQGIVAEEYILELASSLQNYVDEGMFVDMCIHHSRQLKVNKSRLHFQARQVKPGEQDCSINSLNGPMLNK